jgi:hypothetical protein
LKVVLRPTVRRKTHSGDLENRAQFKELLHSLECNPTHSESPTSYGLDQPRFSEAVKRLAHGSHSDPILSREPRLDHNLTGLKYTGQDVLLY